MSINISPTIFYICNDFERALGLELLLPSFHIICIDFNKGILAARKLGAHIFCLEETLGRKNPIFRNSNRLLQIPQVQSYIAQNTPEGTVPNVMFFKIAHNIEQSCNYLGYKYLNTTADLNQLFELKLSQYDMLKNAGVNFPKTTVSSLEEADFNSLRDNLGKSFVLQYDRGHTGSSTVFVEEEADFSSELARYPKRLAKFSTMIEGDAWTINACVTRFGTVWGGLCYQITGIEKCTTKKGGTVGNDWGSTENLHPNTIMQIQDICVKTGNIMQQNGYRGLYGLDLMIDKSGKVFLIEINARQPASTGMHTKLLLIENKIPLELLHIAEFLYEDNSDYVDFLNRTLNKNLTAGNMTDYLQHQNVDEMKSKNASQVIIRNVSSTEKTCNLKVDTGVYVSQQDQLLRVRDGYCIDQLQSEEEMMILAVDGGRAVTPEAEVARIQQRKTAILWHEDQSNIDQVVLNVIDKIV